MSLTLHNPSLDFSLFAGTVMCLSIGTPKNNRFSICSKWKIYYFQASQNLGHNSASL